MTNDASDVREPGSDVRKPYTKPELTIFGDVEKLTQGDFFSGTSDAPFFSGYNMNSSSG